MAWSSSQSKKWRHFGQTPSRLSTQLAVSNMDLPFKSTIFQKRDPFSAAGCRAMFILIGSRPAGACKWDFVKSDRDKFIKSLKNAIMNSDQTKSATDAFKTKIYNIYLDLWEFEPSHHSIVKKYPRVNSGCKKADGRAQGCKPSVSVQWNFDQVWKRSMNGNFGCCEISIHKNASCTRE